MIIRIILIAVVIGAYFIFFQKSDEPKSNENVVTEENEKTTTEDSVILEENVLDEENDNEILEEDVDENK